jgi:hypothetical protein
VCVRACVRVFVRESACLCDREYVRVCVLVGGREEGGCSPQERKGGEVTVTSHAEGGGAPSHLWILTPARIVVAPLPCGRHIKRCNSEGLTSAAVRHNRR